MQLNKYLSHAGLCSRRDAVELIKTGQITINHGIETSPAYRVQENDVVRYNKKVVKLTEQPVYIILNKPAGFVSSTADEKGRRTVINIIGSSIKERIYPVGRLDYNTTGLLLLTNDGELAQKLAHPRFKIKKTYRVLLDRDVEYKDIENIKQGVRLSDGRVKVDRIYVARKDNKKSVFVTLHSGKKHIIKRIFGAFGYHVRGLDRVGFGPLNTRGLSKGKWRHLKKAEIELLSKL